MDRFHDALSIILLATYMFASITAFRYLTLRHGAMLLHWIPPVAMVLHTALLAVEMVQTGRVPLFSLAGAIVFFTWVLMLHYWIADRLLTLRVYGVFLFPIIFTLLVYAFSLPAPESAARIPLGSYGLGVHVTVALVGNSAFAMSFASAMMYLLQEQQLRNKVFDLLYRRLPPLEVLDSFSYRLVILGFPLLTFSIILGVLWARAFWFGDWSTDGKVFWSMLTWLVYAGYLAARSWGGWHGRKAAWLSVAGFISILWNIFVVNRMFSENHLF